MGPRAMVRVNCKCDPYDAEIKCPGSLAKWKKTSSGEDNSEDEVKEGYVHTSSQHGLSKNLAKTSGPTKRARSGNKTLDAGANVDE